MFDRDHTITIPTNFALAHKADADYQRHAAELATLERKILTSPKPRTVLVRALQPFRVNGKLIEVGKLADVIDNESIQALINAGGAERAE